MTNPAITKGFLASLRAALGPTIDELVSRTPHTVPQPGLTREDMGDQGFAAAMEERRIWIRENCQGDVLPEPLRQEGRLVGRRYRFEDPNEAFFFKMRFC